MPEDTIVAISTPPGRGGIGIVRLSGPSAQSMAERLLNLKRPLEPQRIRFAQVLDEDSAVLDECVASFFAAPRSYTGEDVVEIAAHGSPVLLDALLRRCLAAGARLADPGEFTQRAFLSGRIDLTQAEAVDDLIHATTLEQARAAARQMGGGLSRLVKPVKERLVRLIAELEAGIDFAEDDLQLMPKAAILAALHEIEVPLAAMDQSFAYGRVLREGFKLAIVGRPNAGKSSLFNRLICRERAIVTAQPGTTRDPVAERLEFAGIPVELVDTAGLRASTAHGEDLDEAETMGVSKSREAMAEADVVLLVVAANEGLQAEDRVILHEIRGNAGDHLQSAHTRIILVMNKLDLMLRAEPSLPQLDGPTTVETSAIAGTGIDDLRVAVLAKLRAIAPGADTAPLTNLRQHQAISSALGSVRAAAIGIARNVPHEMALIDLHEALAALDQLTGTTHTDEILGLIFSRFCIGK